MLAALGHAGEGGGRIFQLEDRVDPRSQLAGVSTPGQLEQLFAIRLHDEAARALGTWFTSVPLSAARPIVPLVSLPQ